MLLSHMASGVVVFPFFGPSAADLMQSPALAPLDWGHISVSDTVVTQWASRFAYFVQSKCKNTQFSVHLNK